MKNAVLLFAAWSLVGVGAAQSAGTVTISAKAPAASHEGKVYSIDVRINVPTCYHIYGPTVTYGLPTQIAFSGPKGFKGAAKYPPTGVFKSFEGNLQIYSGIVHIPVWVTPNKSAKGKEVVHLKVTVQACNDRTCLLPKTEDLTVVTVLK